MKLKQSEIRQYRNEVLEGHNICPLCGTEIKEEEAVLDHDHETGIIRCVLHRSCNQAEGRIISWVKRSRSDNPLEFIKNLVKYWEADYSDNPIHPSHKTEQEKEILKLKRRMKKLKTQKGKDKIKQQIKELQNQLGE